MEPDGDSDSELLERWQAGDRQAGNRLVRRHHPRVAAFFTNAVNDDDRQDLIQETFRRLTIAKDTFRGTASVRTYLYTIARRVLHDHLRQRYRKADAFDPLTHTVEDVEGVTPSRFVAELQRTRRLLTCLRALPVDTKQLLELYVWHGASARELGKIFGTPADGPEGVPEGTIRRRVHDAKKVLMRCLADEHGVPDSDEVQVDAVLDEQLRELGELLMVGPSGV